MIQENPKELIAYCMTKHEDKIRLLSETALGGPQFKQFIRRHEINIEPPPKEEEKAVEKYVILLSQSFAILNVLLDHPMLVCDVGARDVCSRLRKNRTSILTTTTMTCPSTSPTPSRRRTTPRSSGNVHSAYPRVLRSNDQCLLLSLPWAVWWIMTMVRTLEGSKRLRIHHCLSHMIRLKGYKDLQDPRFLPARS